LICDSLRKQIMRFVYLLIILFAGSLSIKAQTIYDFQLETSEGKTVSYTDIKGQYITVIDFWATWCKPCVNSIPKLVGLSNSYDSGEVAFIGISIDSPRNLSKVKPFTETVGITYPVLLDTDKQLMQDLNVTVIPTLIVVDSEDEIVYMHEGFAPGDEVLLKEEIDRILHESK
jgi:cytochrome c biogenesis protein CcmG, thiol:disulfide interchange protein DsbE